MAIEAKKKRERTKKECEDDRSRKDGWLAGDVLILDISVCEME